MLGQVEKSCERFRGVLDKRKTGQIEKRTLQEKDNDVKKYW